MPNTLFEGTRWAWVPRALAIACFATVGAALVSDQINLAAALASAERCGPPVFDFVSKLGEHLDRAAPFLVILAVRAISLRLRPRLVFVVFDAAAVAVALYALKLSLDWSIIPDAQTCGESDWDNYNIINVFRQILLLWPFAGLFLAAHGVTWIIAYFRKTEA